jgi:prepilin-type N-terminal cleavage/methylation domain-containing protein
MTKLNKGFTLIELLVVIAIIGILSGLIIVSMNSATKTANDARVEAGLDQARTVAQIYAINHNNSFNSSTEAVALTACGTGTASTFMEAGSDMLKICNDFVNYDTGTPAINISADGAKYCMQVGLQGGGSWCIDSTGYAGKTNVVCDTANYDCAADD